MTLDAAPRPTPPATEAELLLRAHALGGRTLGELAAQLGHTLPPDARHAKGLVGQLIERALGGAGTSADQPDFPALGIELKTIPVRRDGRPRESTFVCTIDLRSIGDGDWESSRARRKLARVLWVPVESDPALPLTARRIGTAVLWSPAGADESALRGDWEQLAGMIAHGDIELIDARIGHALQVRPKAAHGGSRGRAVDAAGAPVRTLPRGFYLRATFTAHILRQAFGVHPAAVGPPDRGPGARA